MPWGSPQLRYSTFGVRHSLPVPIAKDKQMRTELEFPSLQSLLLSSWATELEVPLAQFRPANGSPIRCQNRKQVRAGTKELQFRSRQQPTFFVDPSEYQAVRSLFCEQDCNYP